ncbi:hypothetical protein PVK06_026913 [Gossypium arboreum]|uniref:BED-type domain-containing protein n=1 Tax=Gossypium arboreum TaxID=29729 RepID=A0ABR0NZF2_GOSAR|nr:hypothetical protein PVK06_026913 [Gossypium arboreum]
MKLQLQMLAYLIYICIKQKHHLLSQDITRISDDDMMTRFPTVYITGKFDLFSALGENLTGALRTSWFNDNSDIRFLIMASQSGNGSVGSSNNVINASVSQDDIGNTPLWRYVTKLPKIVEEGRNVSFVCNFCSATFKGSYSRVKAHLLKLNGQGIRVCPKVALQHLVEMQKIVEDAKLKLQPKIVQLPPSSQTLASSFGPTQPHFKGII